MIPGQMTSSAPGDPDEIIADLEVSNNASGLGSIVSARAVSGYTFNAIILADEIEGDVIGLSDEVYSMGNARTSFARTTHSLSLVPIGDWPGSFGVNPVWQQIYFSLDKGKSLNLSWDVINEVSECYGDSGQFGDWEISGVSRYAYGSSVFGFPTRKRLFVELTNPSGEYRSAVLYNGDSPVASGEYEGDGEITLDELNGSGIQAVSSVAYTTDIDKDYAWIDVRWAKSYEVHCAIGLTLPHTPNKTVFDSGVSDRLEAVITGLSPGTYDYMIRAVSDSAITQSAVVLGSVVVPGRPEPPGEITDASGDYLATTIYYEASETSGATYNIYEADIGDPIDWSTPSATHVSGSGELSSVLPACSMEAGLRRVGVDSVFGGIESGYRREILLEYNASGELVENRPNDPSFAFSSSSGLTVNVGYTYDPKFQKGTASQVCLFLAKEDEEPDWTSPDDTASIGSSVAIGTLSAEVDSAGWYNYIVRAKATTTYNEGEILSGPIFVSDSSPSGDYNVEIEVIG